MEELGFEARSAPQTDLADQDPTVSRHNDVWVFLPLIVLLGIPFLDTGGGSGG